MKLFLLLPFLIDAVIIHENEPPVFVFSVRRRNRRVKRETGVMKIVSSGGTTI